MSLRTLQRRVAKLEKAGKPRPSPIVIAYGSFEAFADQTYAEIRAGKLDQNDALTLVEVLRHWEVSGVWEMALATA